jgi:hypothetical protein
MTARRNQKTTTTIGGRAVDLRTYPPDVFLQLYRAELGKLTALLDAIQASTDERAQVLSHALRAFETMLQIHRSEGRIWWDPDTQQLAVVPRELWAERFQSGDV